MIKFNTETDARLQPGEDEGKLDCGCILFYDDQDCACLRMCPMHTAAPALLHVCKSMLAYFTGNQVFNLIGKNQRDCHLARRMAEAVAKAETP